jgi:hypothetical protein
VTGMTDIENRAQKGGKAPPNLRPELAVLFEEVVATSPPFSTRRSFVQLVRERVGIDYSPRTIERWRLAVQMIKGEATFPTVAGLERVFADLNDAPVICRGGDRQAAA